MKRSNDQRKKLSTFTSPPVSLEEPSPPDSASRGGSAGVLMPRDWSFLAADSKETPWTAVRVLNLLLLSFWSYPHHLLTLFLFPCSSAAPLIQQIGVLTAVPLCVVMRSSTCFLLLHLSRAPRLAEVKFPVLPSFRPSAIFCQWRKSYFPFCPNLWRSSVVSFTQWVELCGLCLTPPTIGFRKTCLVGTS